MLFITHMKWKDEVVIGLKCEEKIWLETIKVRWEEKIDHNKLLRELLTYKKLCQLNDYIQEIQHTAENKIEEEKIWARYLFWSMSIYQKQAHVHIFFQFVSSNMDQYTRRKKILLI